MFSVEQSKRAKAPSNLIALSMVAITGFVIWASLASLDEVVRGPGEVVPTSQTQVIQSLEGGILATMPVWEGKIVEAGEIVATLNDNQFLGAYKEIEGQIAAFEARLLRLDAEINFASSLSLPSNICQEAANVCQSEQNFFRASKAEYASSTGSFRSAIGLAEREATMKREMADEDILPEVDALEAQQAFGAEKAKLAEYQAEYRTIRSKEYADTVTEINALKAQLDVRGDQLTRTALRAPVRAIVNKVLVSTIGGVAPPGEPILELTPLDEDLRIEAKISPQDVAFVRPGMDATVKLTAFDYTIYGTLNGRVTHVSADTFQEEGVRDEKPYYKVFVAVEPNAEGDFSSKIEVRPGMVAEVELHTGSKTVLQYLLKPLFKSTEAFTER